MSEQISKGVIKKKPKPLRDFGRAYLPCGEKCHLTSKGHARGRVQRMVYKVLALCSKVWRTTHFFSLERTFPSGGWVGVRSLRCPFFSSSQVPAWRDAVVRGYMPRWAHVFSKVTPIPAVINRSIDCPPCLHPSFFTLIATRFAHVRG